MQTRIREKLLCAGIVLLFIATIIIPIGKGLLNIEQSMVTSQRSEIEYILAEMEAEFK